MDIEYPMFGRRSYQNNRLPDMPVYQWQTPETTHGRRHESHISGLYEPSKAEQRVFAV